MFVVALVYVLSKVNRFATRGDKREGVELYQELKEWSLYRTRESATLKRASLLNIRQLITTVFNLVLFIYIGKWK